MSVTFKLGTDLDTAQVLTQNRVSVALPRLPEDGAAAWRYGEEERRRTCCW